MLTRNELFEVQKWDLAAPRDVAASGQFTIVCCLTGKIACSGVELNPGEFFLVPALSADRKLKAVEEGTALLRITVPS
jgi:mannose-6-phosphate isomerase class I